MGLTGQRPWSWAALASWLAGAGLAIVVAAGLLFGPELADRAWDQGVHVTPAQAASHAALRASGFSHHHAHGSVPAVVHSEQAAVDAYSSGSSWGTPFTPAARPELPACPALPGCAVLPVQQAIPHSVDLAPLSPPPELVEASTSRSASY